MSYAQIASASGLSKARIGQMAIGAHLRQMPSPASITGLARALDLPVEQVEEAAAASLQTPSARPGVSGGLVRRISALPARDRAVIEAVLRALEER